ncbi:hypothetical protein ACM64Y_20410, partial [Novispirillum sp. DQ9]|uniref:hypothetical protein n=1 Tax=Novispirillum sp. DQ9 TaxID=3398612 RepID=UPI003C7E1B17
VSATFGDFTDGSETHTLVLTAPADWTPTALNGWTDNGDGTFSRTVTGGAFSGDGPTFDAPADSDVDGAFSVVASAVEAENGDTVTVSDSTTVAVEAVADPVTVDITAPGIDEDGTVTPTVSATFGDFTDGSETHTLVLTAPADWTPTALNGWTDNGDGTFSRTVTGGAFSGDGPTFDAPADSDVDGAFSVVASAIEAENGDTVTASASTTVAVEAVADPVTVDISAPGIDEDGTVTPTVSATFGDFTDGSETHTLVLTAPADWTPTALNGWTDNGDGTFSRTVSGGAFSGDGPTFDAPADSDVDGAFSVVASAVEAENGDTVTASDSTVVAVEAVADPVTVDISAPGIDEDGSVTPTVSATFGDFTDGSETHTLVLTAPADWTPTAL